MAAAGLGVRPACLKDSCGARCQGGLLSPRCCHCGSVVEQNTARQDTGSTSSVQKVLPTCSRRWCMCASAPSRLCQANPRCLLCSSVKHLLLVPGFLQGTGESRDSFPIPTTEGWAGLQLSWELPRISPGQLYSKYNLFLWLLKQKATHTGCRKGLRPCIRIIAP